MKIHKIVVGPIETNCYLLADEKTKETIIIDPGDEAVKILDVIKKHNLKPKSIILTHRHFDHIGALDEIKKLTTSQVVNLKEGLSAEALAKEGDVVELGGLKLKIIETPGHSEDSICVVCEKEGIIFTGDTLFKSGIGRTDLEGGDYGQIQKSLKRLMQYPDHYKIYPGHGPDSTIGKEKLHLRF